MGPVGARNKKGLVAEINVTPLVDVMLVLLIIFMVSAPMMTQGVDVDLPKTTSKALPQKEHPLIVTIKESGECFLGEDKNPLSLELLQEKLLRRPDSEKENALFVRADKNVPYGVFARTMEAAKSAGFKKLGLVTSMPENKK